MASVNNNASVVVVGRTAPVPPGQQPSANSVPVVIASDQSAIPVEEQNKQQSEVALSLLGIPRSEVALGIFADVNTYDVNPSEWSNSPEQFSSLELFDPVNTTEYLQKYEGLGSGASFDSGLTHIAEEAGAMIEAPPGSTTVLTSKRFFRYQPGRVSAATFGVKLNRAPYTTYTDSDQTDLNGYETNAQVRNPAIKKYGIFDKYDGYYFESRNDGRGDNFVVVRRTQSIIRDNPLPFGDTAGFQNQDYEWVGVPQVESSRATFPVAYEIIKANKRYLQEVAVNSGLVEPVDYAKCRRDSGLVIEGILHDLKYGGNASTVYNTLRFFKKTNAAPLLYIDDITAELNRYAAISTTINTLLGGGTPATINSIPSINLSALGYTPSNVETTASSQTGSLISILTTALNGANYASIPEPVGSAAGEMCVFRDGLIMTHAAANDPSLLKPKTQYVISQLIEDDVVGGQYNMRVAVPTGAELLQVGQAVRFNKNGQNSGEFSVNAGVPNNILYDDSYWYVASIKNQFVFSQVLYQVVSLQLNPSNEESYASGIAGGNDTNGWGDDTSLAFPDPGTLSIIGASDRNGSLTPVAGIINVSSLNFSLETPVPFVLPNDVSNGRPYSGIQYTDRSFPNAIVDDPQFADGAFPYLYPPGSGYNDASNSRGYIDSAFSNSVDLKSQMNYVNKRLYKNWCWFNVDPKYYKVYEYRVPRSRMSGEKLNGIETPVVYSDNVLDKKAGQPVLDEATGENLTFDSVWDLDPTKVTMYKVEFSWYGAVGATFLAYVPVENNEARWVRVHHLRASNQLKVASLGNATLPITYLVYGGGGQYSYGYLNSSRIPNTESGYGSYSEQLTKYGASYYIDGGDRGTVRLFSYAKDDLEQVGGSKYRFSSGSIYSGSATAANTTSGQNYVNAPFITISETLGLGSGGSEDIPQVSDYYMNAKVVTGNPSDLDVRVVWVDESLNRLYLSRVLAQTSGDVQVIVERPKPLVGIRCRREINGVRNRVQIYPTRLATGSVSNSDSLVLQLIKTPAFQTTSVPGPGTLYINDFINIGNRGKKTLLNISGGEATLVGGDVLQNDGDSLYGYFRYTVPQSLQAFTTLGLLSREEGKYYFSAYEVSVEDRLIRGTFLPAGNWSGPGGNPTDPTERSPDLNSLIGSQLRFPRSQLSRLSAVETDSEIRSPIPGTGTVVTTLFSPNSGQEYELSPYFDYNKDYLSFPLTDIEDTLYVAVSSRDSYNDGGFTNKGSILASITWEEQ